MRTAYARPSITGSGYFDFDAAVRVFVFAEPAFMATRTRTALLRLGRLAEGAEMTRGRTVTTELEFPDWFRWLTADLRAEAPS